MKNNTDNPTSPQPPRRSKNVSERQLAANRANAQKSTGPRTEAGKSVSKFNNLRHGLTCFMVCLPGENKDDYESARAEYYAYWQPTNAVERGLVDAAFSARWRIEHIIRGEKCLIREQMFRLRSDNEKIYDQLSTDYEVSLAIKFLCDNSNVLERMNRQEARLERIYFRSNKQLMQLKGVPVPLQDPGSQPTMQTPQLENLQTEPVPTNEHPATPDLEPIGNATAPGTIVLKPKISQSEPATHNPQLTTPNSQLITHNPQLTTPPPPPLVMTAGAGFPYQP